MEGRSSVELSLALTKHLELKRQLRRVFIEMLALSETHERAAYESALVAFQEDEVDDSTLLVDPKLIQLLALPRPARAVHPKMALSDRPMSPSKRSITIRAHQHPERNFGTNSDSVRVKSEPSALLTKKYTPPLRAPPKLSACSKSQPQQTISHTVTKKEYMQEEDMVTGGRDNKLLDSVQDDAKIEASIGNSIEIVEADVEKASEEERPSVVKFLEMSLAIFPPPLPGCVEIVGPIVEKANEEVQGGGIERDLTEVRTISMSSPNEPGSLSIVETADETLVKEVNEGMEEETQMVGAHAISKGSIGFHIETATVEDVPSIIATQDQDTIREAVIESIVEQTMGPSDSPKTIEDEIDKESSADAISQLIQEEKPVEIAFADFAIEVYKVSLEDTLIEPNILAGTSTIDPRDVEVPVEFDTWISDDTIIEPSFVAEVSPLVSTVNDHFDGEVIIVTTSNESSVAAQVSPLLVNDPCDVEVPGVIESNESTIVDEVSSLAGTVADPCDAGVPVVIESNEFTTAADEVSSRTMNDLGDVEVTIMTGRNEGTVIESITTDEVSPLVVNDQCDVEVSLVTESNEAHLFEPNADEVSHLIVNNQCDVEVPDMIESNEDPLVETTIGDEAYSLVGMVNAQCEVEVPDMIESNESTIVDEVSPFVSTINDQYDFEVSVAIESNDEPVVDALTSDEVSPFVSTKNDLREIEVPVVIETTGVNEEPLLENAEGSNCDVEATVAPESTGTTVINGCPVIESSSPAEGSVLAGEGIAVPQIEAIDDENNFIASNSIGDEVPLPSVSTRYVVDDHLSSELTMNEEVYTVVSMVNNRCDVEARKDVVQPSDEPHRRSNGVSSTVGDGKQEANEEGENVSTNRVGSSSPVKPPVSVCNPTIMIDTSSPQQVDRDWKKKFKASLQNMPVFGSASMAPPNMYASSSYGSSSAHSQAREQTAQEFMFQSPSIVGAVNKTSVATAQQDVVSELTRALRQRIKADDDFL